ncbi:MAG TPA: hypothetical protein VFF52_08685 [Isosphaeraceae bacterium]|nr:hypothetical protein [Isosphaeraceae bacterium]
MNRTSHGRRWRIIWLLGIPGLIVGGEARAQSHEAAKRSFAELLGRRGRVAREAGAAGGSSFAGASRDAFSHAARRRRHQASDFDGLAAASPLAPSGYGVGRDAFVETMYEETFGRAAKHRELDRLTKMLAFGMSPQTLALILWRSPEHRALRRAGRAPTIPFGRAYRNAMAAGWQARRGFFVTP